MKISFIKFTTLLGFYWVSSLSHAATPLPEGAQFQIIGLIQSFKLDPSLCPGTESALQGARMKVNGLNIVIPCNTIITMPGSYLTPEDIFHGPSLNPNAVQAQSGLALEDTPSPLGSYEVTIEGNIVSGQHRAGLVHIAQQGLNNGVGYITAIDRATGMIRVGSSRALDAVNDAYVRLNDPAGRYGLKTTAADATFPTDERFTSDDENPTVHAETGFPMCIPRPGTGSDALCPDSNRPADHSITNFVMGPALASFPAAVSCSSCNPNLAVPLVVGDYINYSGTLAKANDATGTVYISAHTVAAALGIFTQPGSKPVYVSQEVSLIGTGGAPFSGVGQEISPRDIKVEGFTTDPSRPIDIYALAVNSCTGAENEIKVGTVDPGDIPFGRFRFEVKRAQSPVPIPLVREFRVKAQQGTVTNGNGLLAGQYTAPVSEYIFPENNVFGDPIIPFNFQNFPFLAQGSGPLCTVGHQDTVGKCPFVGQLIPWPGVSTGPRAPLSANCPP